MFSRHAVLGLALVATGLVAGGATVFAGEEGTPTPLHGSAAHAGDHAVSIALDRTRVLRQVDRLLDDLRELDRLAHVRRSAISVEIGHGRRLRDAGGESPGGELPVSRGRSPVESLARPEVRDDRAETLAHRQERGGYVVDWDADRDIDRDIDRRVNRMTRELAALHESLLGAPILRPQPVVRVEPVSDHAFREYLRAVCAPHWDDERLEVLSDVVRHEHFTAAQAADMIDRGFRFMRVEAALLLYPRVLDPEHVHLIYASLRWSSDRDELQRAIRALER